MNCECGHESCYHRPKPNLVAGMFGDAPTKCCNVKDCQCLRYTLKKTED